MTKNEENNNFRNIDVLKMEDYDWENDFDNGEDNTGGDAAGLYSGKNVVLFAIYGGEAMHKEDGGEEGKTLFQKAVMAAVDTYKV